MTVHVSLSGFLSLVTLLLIAPHAHAADTTSLSSLYWCPSRTGDELQLTAAPGCEPLIDEKKDADSPDRSAKTKPRPRIDDLETAVGAFLRDYRDFLRCCAQDSMQVDEVTDLEDRASDLLKEGVARIGPAAFLASRNKAMILPVAHARSALRALRDRLGRIQKSKDQVETLDYGHAARERRAIQEAEDGVAKEFRPDAPPSRATTGTAIGRTAPTGGEIGSSAPTGTHIGTPSPTGSNIGATPPTLGEVSGASPRERSGGSLTTTTPVTSGTSGPTIGTTPSTGLAIDNSPFNSGP